MKIILIIINIIILINNIYILLIKNVILWNNIYSVPFTCKNNKKVVKYNI